jgi:hypothetical protein
MAACIVIAGTTLVRRWLVRYYITGHDRYDDAHNHNSHDSATLPQWKQQRHEEDNCSMSWYDDQGGVRN